MTAVPAPRTRSLLPAMPWQETVVLAQGPWEAPGSAVTALKCLSDLDDSGGDLSSYSPTSTEVPNEPGFGEQTVSDPVPESASTAEITIPLPFPDTQHKTCYRRREVLTSRTRTSWRRLGWPQVVPQNRGLKARTVPLCAQASPLSSGFSVTHSPPWLQQLRIAGHFQLFAVALDTSSLTPCGQ
ncbi:hypothetical protein CB1_000345006 [Camelus ferus]|nr:hypothetical protein CB1_000345006 [Camelus ferus]